MFFIRTQKWQMSDLFCPLNCVVENSACGNDLLSLHDLSILLFDGRRSTRSTADDTNKSNMMEIASVWVSSD